ncbi:MAG TPA: aldo/keto reductase [Bacteroidales bacterium]
MKKDNRRNFLKNSFIAASGIPLIASALKPSLKTTFAETEKKLVYRTLGKTGLKVPIVSMGTGDTDNAKLVDAALSQGIVLLATSQYYGNGKNEQMLGEVFKGRKRDSFLIATSVMPDGIDFKNGLYTDASKEEPFMKKFEGSLQRLGLDHVDILWLPFAGKRESVFYEPLLKAMENIKKQGKARFIGIATHSYETEAIRAATDTKIYDVIMTAYNFRKKNIAEMNEAITYAASAGLGIVAMKTMAGAFWDKERTKPINTKAALKWVLQNENIHTTVPGFTTFDQLDQNMKIMADLQLTDQEKTDLVADIQLSNGVYCQQCGECIPQCTQSLDIPTIMRSYMYAYGYKNLTHARQTLTYTGTTLNPCDNCTSCGVNCKMGFDVKQKITDIARLKNVPSDFLLG